MARGRGGRYTRWPMVSYEYTTIPSPVGKLTLVASANGLCALYFEQSKQQAYLARMRAEGSAAENAQNKHLVKAAAQLAEYFAGKRRDFDVKLDMQGSVFQLSAWRALQQIPYGQTCSYAQQAASIGDAKKARAVGMANGLNPLAIVVPCHRVVGASGSLTGFAGGLKAKQYLLEHEQKHCA